MLSLRTNMRAQLFFIWICVAAAQSTVSIPSTGARRLSGDLDANWKVASQLQDQEWTGEAAIVLKPGGGWAAPEPGAGWIAPNHDQSNATRPGTCCAGVATYTLNFNVDNPETAQIQMRIAVDDTITMYLNGSGLDSVVYSTTEPTFAAPVAHTLKQGALYVGPFGVVRSTMRFVKGQNTLRVEVSNANGPTGLYIAVTAPLGAGESFTNTAPSEFGADAVEDSVDSASGQYYDTAVDFRLGGPLDLAFERYYSSQLSRSGKSTSLGTNWMGTFDTAVQLSGASARVLLSGGRVVTFTSSAGAWQLTSPRSKAYQFSASGVNFQFLDSVSQWLYTFNAAGALTRIEDRNGNAITVTQGPKGPTRVADNNGRSLNFDYNAAQLLSRVTDNSGRSTSYAYTSAGVLTSVTDALGNVTRYDYTATGAMLTRETLPADSALTTQTYDANGRVLTRVDPCGNTIRIAYDGQAGTTVTSPTGAITRQKSDVAGSITQFTDATGAVSNTIYDSSGRPTTVTYKNGSTRRFTYLADGGLASVTDELGKTTSFTYSAQTKAPFTFQNLTGITYADGTRATMSYDANGNVTAFTTPDGATTQYSYDSSGRQTRVAGPAKQLTTYFWNNDGTLASTRDALGNTTSFQYDALKRITQRIDPNGVSSQFAYDANGRIISEAVPGNPANAIAYDANGRITSRTDALNNRYSYTYTSTGKIATETDPRDARTTYSYDANDRLVKIQDAAGEAVTLTYNANSQITTIRDNSGLRSAYTYDAGGRLLSETDGTGRRSTWNYDAAGRIVTASTADGTPLSEPNATGRGLISANYAAGRIATPPTAAGALTGYSYDSRGSLIGETNPMGEMTTMTRDALGRLLTTTLPGGVTSKIERDAAGRPTSITSPEGNKWSFQWDALGRLETMTDPLGKKESYIYKGTLLAKVDMPVGSFTVSSDTAGRPLKFAYSDGTVLNRTSDASGFLLTTDGLALKRDAMSNIVESNGIGVTLDKIGRISKLTYADAKVITYTYDAAGRVNSISDWVGGKTSIRYDAGSRVQAIVYPNGVENLWRYDSAGYVSSIVYGGHGSVSLTRDSAGRVVSAERNLPLEPVLFDSVQNFAYGPGSRLASASYDDMGRVTEQTNRTFTWDLASRLTAFADPVNFGTLTYDGLGAMTSSRTTLAAQSYVVNYTTDLPSAAIVRAGEADQRYYVYLPNGELLYSLEAADGARRFYHFDEMGNTVLLTNDAGEMTDGYAITPYGEVVDHPGTSDNPFTFQGRYGVMQEAAGLFSMRARHYDATSARFLSPDKRLGSAPLESEPYVYANANPLMFNGTLGMWPWDGLVQVIGDGVMAIGNTIQNAVKPSKSAFKKPSVTPLPSAPPKVISPTPLLVPLSPLNLPPLPLPVLTQPIAIPPVGPDAGNQIDKGIQAINQDGGPAQPPSLVYLRPPNAYKTVTAPKAKNNKK